MTKQEITDKINSVYEAVESSKCGKLTTGERDPNNNVVYNGFALQVFMKALDSEFGKK